MLKSGTPQTWRTYSMEIAMPPPTRATGNATSTRSSLKLTRGCDPRAWRHHMMRWTGPNQPLLSALLPAQPPFPGFRTPCQTRRPWAYSTWRQSPAFRGSHIRSRHPVCHTPIEKWAAWRALRSRIQDRAVPPSWRSQAYRHCPTPQRIPQWVFCIKKW